jgi:hypothetical protein
MERLNYSPAEIREAFRFAGEQAKLLVEANSGNFRRNFTRFVAAMTARQEALKLLVRLLDGHRELDAKKWYAEAAERRPPPLPKDRYGRLALVWKLLPPAVERPGPDQDVKVGVDVPYVMAYAFPGESLGEKFEAFRAGYLAPFAEELAAWGEAILAKIPKKAESVDLWDVALAALV